MTTKDTLPMLVKILEILLFKLKGRLIVASKNIQRNLINLISYNLFRIGEYKYYLEEQL